eukprot:597112-Amphidinium_carterae.1
MVALSRPCGAVDSAALKAQAARLHKGWHPSRAPLYRGVRVHREYAVALSVRADWLFQTPLNPTRLASAFES